MTGVGVGVVALVGSGSGLVGGLELTSCLEDFCFLLGQTLDYLIRREVVFRQVPQK